MAQPNKLKDKIELKLEKKDAPPSTVVMPEDLELDRFLEAQNSKEPELSDRDPVSVFVKKETPKRELLEGYPVAKTTTEIREQVYQAKLGGYDSIEATLDACRGITRDPLLEETGYLMFQDIKVYVEGSFERARARDAMSIEQRNFGKSTEHERRQALKDQIKALEKQLEERA